MKFIKNNLKVIIAFIVGLILSGGIVYAVTSASQVAYTTTKNAEIETVADALNDLYDKSFNTTLIWTNSSSTSNFSAQTINLNLTKYDAVIIQTSYSLVPDNTSNYYLEANYALIDVGSNGKTVAPDESVAFHSIRNVTVSSTGITFSTGTVFGYNLPTSTGEGYGIPLKIYGIKYL